MDLMDFLSVPQVQKKDWMSTVHMERATAATLPSIIDMCITSGRYGLDFESTGLDTRVFDGRTVSRIVGCCIAPDVDHGYYIPLAHQVGEDFNVPMSVFDKEIRRLLESDAVAVFHNAKYDTELAEFNGSDPWGNWDDVKRWDCTLVQCYILNSREIQKGLKFLAKRDLGMEMITLEELFPDSYKGDLDFSQLDPGWEPVTWYGCGDAICTLRLDSLYRPQIAPDEGLNLNIIYLIEKLCTVATRWMERNRLHINKPLVAELIEGGQREYLEAMQEVYDGAAKILGRDVSPPYFKKLVETAVFDRPDLGETIVDQISRLQGHSNTLEQDEVSDGKVYDIKSQTQLGQLFEELKVPGLKYTEKSKQVKTSRDELDRVLLEAEAQFPFLKKIIRYRELEKALSTYLYPLYQDADKTTDTIWVDYNGLKTDTGRFSTPGRSLKKRGGLQGGTRYFLQGTPSTYDPHRPVCMQRIRECFDTRDVTDPTTRQNIRKILEQGGYDVDNPLYYKKFFVAVDYAGVELRLVTNFSREPKWIKEFYRCSSCGFEFDQNIEPPPFCPVCGSDKIGDLHTLSGITFYGESAPERDDWKQLRGNAKSTNFALCYGGGGKAVQRTINCDINEGWRIKNKFDETYTTLRRWWDIQHKFAEDHEYVLTGFHRKYPLPDINNEDKFFKSKAERNSTNGPIQGTSADMTKIAMGLIYRECRQRGWLEKCMMIITMHDELCFEIDPDIIEEALDMIEEIMVHNKFIMRKKWPVPFRVDIEMGYDWTVKWNFTKIRHGKKPCPEGLRPFMKNLPEYKDPKGTPPTEGGETPPEPIEVKDTEQVKTLIYQIKYPLSEPVLAILYRVIVGSHDLDGHQLEIESEQGESLTPGIMRALELPETPGDIRVDPLLFHQMLQEYSLGSN